MLDAWRARELIVMRRCAFPLIDVADETWFLRSLGYDSVPVLPDFLPLSCELSFFRLVSDVYLLVSCSDLF